MPGVLILYVRHAPAFGHAIPFIHFIVSCTPVSGAIDLMYLISMVLFEGLRWSWHYAHQAQGCCIIKYDMHAT